MTIKNIIRQPVKKLGLPIFSFKHTQEVTCQYRNILDAFNGNLTVPTEDQKGTPLDCGSELGAITGITKLFSQHEDKDRIVDIIKK